MGSKGRASRGTRQQVAEVPGWVWQTVSAEAEGHRGRSRGGAAAPTLLLRPAPPRAAVPVRPLEGLIVPSSATGALPAPRAGGEATTRHSRFVCVAPGSPLSECVRPPGCQRIRTPLLWERNVCYASPPVCPQAAPATMLFVAMSAPGRTYSGKGNFKHTSPQTGTVGNFF